MRNRNRSVPSQLIVGIAVIGMGLLFLLDNLGWWDFHAVLRFWPMVFIVVGALKLADTSSPNGIVVGLVLILLGATMTMQRLGFLYVSWHTMWPILLVLCGVSFVVRALVGRRDAASPDAQGQSDESQFEVTAIMSGVQRRIVAPQFRGGEITAIMGGCELDLRGSAIDGEAVINLFALCGGVAIKVPADWTVVFQGAPILGGFEDKTSTPPDGSKRLLLKGYAIMGGLEVRN